MGFDLCELTALQIPELDQNAYKQWIASGHAGSMSYMTRDPEKRLTPTLVFPEAKSVISLGVSYYQGDFPEKPGPAYGRVARYAWGRDYHDVIQERLLQLVSLLEKEFGSHEKFWPAIDTKPVLERSLANSSGMGFIGKNTVLISPGSKGRFHVGSWLFLGELFSSMPLESEDSFGKPSITAGCGSCDKCITACPTKAFEGPYRLNAEKCISYLTIENKTWIPFERRSSMGDWLFGCDVCQEVCPFNARAFESHWPELAPENGVGAWLSLKELLSLPSQIEFKSRFASTPLSRPKRKGLLRNACIVAGNSKDESLVSSLEMLLNDAEPVLRGHAVDAISRLVSVQTAKKIAEKLLKDETDPNVRIECERILA